MFFLSAYECKICLYIYLLYLKKEEAMETDSQENEEKKEEEKKEEKGSEEDKAEVRKNTSLLNDLSGE